MITVCDDNVFPGKIDKTQQSPFIHSRKIKLNSRGKSYHPLWQKSPSHALKDPGKNTWWALLTSGLSQIFVPPVLHGQAVRAAASPRPAVSDLERRGGRAPRVRGAPTALLFDFGGAALRFVKHQDPSKPPLPIINPWQYFVNAWAMATWLLAHIRLWSSPNNETISTISIIIHHNHARSPPQTMSEPTKWTPLVVTWIRFAKV